MIIQAGESNELAERGKQSRLDTPDGRFMACCQSRQLPDVCLGHCTFQSYSRQSLQVLYRTYFK